MAAERLRVPLVANITTSNPEIRETQCQVNPTTSQNYLDPSENMFNYSVAPYCRPISDMHTIAWITQFTSVWLSVSLETRYSLILQTSVAFWQTLLRYVNQYYQSVDSVRLIRQRINKSAKYLFV